MEISTKIKVLDAIYDIYDWFVKDINYACKKLCSYCCTSNVTLTSLEAYKIIKNSKGKIAIMLNEFCLSDNSTRFIPSVTVNKMAELCSCGEDLPEESSKNGAGLCLALSRGECGLYEERPFGCRCMVSTQNCGDRGIAVMDPYLLTVNNVFIQCIENVDVSGYTSNFYDLLLALSSKKSQCYYENGCCFESENLIKNQPIHTLMVPPEHIERIQPLLAIIRDIKV